MAYPGYLGQIPSNTFQMAIVSALWAVLTERTWTPDEATAVRAGRLSWSATIVHGIVTPVFRRLGEPNAPLTMKQEMLRGAVSVLGAHAFDRALGHEVTVMCVLLNLALCVLMVTFLGPRYRDPTAANFMCVFPPMKWPPMPD